MIDSISVVILVWVVASTFFLYSILVAFNVLFEEIREIHSVLNEYKRCSLSHESAYRDTIHDLDIAIRENTSALNELHTKK